MMEKKAIRKVCKYQCREQLWLFRRTPERPAARLGEKVPLYEFAGNIP